MLGWMLTTVLHRSEDQRRRPFDDSASACLFCQTFACISLWCFYSWPSRSYRKFSLKLVCITLLSCHLNLVTVLSSLLTLGIIFLHLNHLLEAKNERLWYALKCILICCWIGRLYVCFFVNVMLFYLTLFYVVICYLYYMCFFVNWIVDMRMDGQVFIHHACLPAVAKQKWHLEME